MSLIVYGYPNTRTLRVTWLLEELGLEYKFELVDLMKGAARKEPFISLNPGGKVPVLQTEAGVLTESLAIVNYLCSIAPDSELIPTLSPYRRAQYDQWTVFSMVELEQPLWTIGKNKFALPKDYRVADIIPTAEYEFQVALKLLSQGLAEHDYILGDHFTAADILIGHSLFWGMSFGQKIEQENLKAYMGRLGVRPALSAARDKEKQALSA